MDLQPIETAPLGAWVLVWDGERFEVARGIPDRTFYGGDWDYEVAATHWAPLPKPPSDSDTRPKDGDAKQGSTRE